MQNSRIPDWLRRPAGNTSHVANLKQLLRRGQLNTVCEEARCPNISECFGRGIATFMILGDVCTRHCPFCSITSGIPNFGPERFEAEVAELVATAQDLKLRHVVLTSVTRDDLPDGGATEFFLAVTALKKAIPEISVEVLIPDFKGDRNSLQQVLDASPEILNHNLETVPRLYRQVRPGAKYHRSLELLANAKKLQPHQMTKTGIMLGLGEEQGEVLELMRDARAHSVDIFTAGQYMQPSRKHLSVVRYLALEEFDWYREQAHSIGFTQVAIGPLVRSSYHADHHAHELGEHLKSKCANSPIVNSPLTNSPLTNSPLANSHSASLNNTSATERLPIVS